ncbi:MAG: hypothetical protein J7621_22245 [Niastella sp.]|jgi:hypothetical protein|nr:hypothetical protein [Niastella sp.]
MNVLIIIIRIVFLLLSSLPVLFSIILHTAYQRVRNRFPASVYDGEIFSNASDRPYFQAADYLLGCSFYAIPVGIALVIVLLYTPERRQSMVNRFFVILYLCSIFYLFISLSGKAGAFYFD